MSAILFSKENGLATITLNRPEAYNSVNAELALAWIAALADCQKDDTVRAVLITGTGKAFCAGQDLKEVTNPDTNPGFEHLLEKHYGPIVRGIVNLEKPVVAAVNGVAAGAGANLALCCDIVLAIEHASFIQAFSAIGLVPDSAGTYFLPRLIGRSKAMAYAMLGDKISAQQAEKEGMIYRCIVAEEFEQEVLKIANKLANMPTKGLGMTKKAINQSLESSFEEQLQLETTLQIAAAETKDSKEGVLAFVEKRKPLFTGE